MGGDNRILDHVKYHNKNSIHKADGKPSLKNNKTGRFTVSFKTLQLQSSTQSSAISLEGVS